MQKGKKILRIIWNEFVYGGHLLSLGAVSIVYTAAVLLNIKITWDGLLIFYLGPQSVYLYNRYKEFEEDALTNRERTRHIKRYVEIIPLIIFFYILIFIGILLFFNKTTTLITGLFLLFLTFSYSLIFKKLTKKIIAFKNLFVSLCWSLLIIFLAIYYSFPLNLSLFLILVFVYLRLFIHEVFFDIKDLEGDRKRQLLVLPSFVEKQKLINILILISILSFVPILFGYYLKLFPGFSLMLLFLIFYSLYYSKKLKLEEASNSFLYYILIDGEYMLWLPLVLLGKFLL